MSRDSPDSPAIDADSATLIESSHAAKLLAAADSGLLATGVHVYACQVSSDLRSVSVVLAGAQSRPVLANILATRRVALVACHIKSYKTVQVKGDDAQVIATTDDLRRAAVNYCEEFAHFAAGLGYPFATMRAHIDCRPEDAVVVRFTGRRAFNQTPGPAAGQPLAARAGRLEGAR